jgi:hypothetical protein
VKKKALARRHTVAAIMILALIALVFILILVQNSLGVLLGLLRGVGVVEVSLVAGSNLSIGHNCGVGVFFM